MGNTEVKRKAIPKKVRLQVYEKCNGHCAYCGCELDYKDMQVDHIDPVYIYKKYNHLDTIENYNPACRQCNFYKSTLSIEKYREQLNTITERLEKDFTYRIARNYGVIKESKEPIKFYYETMS